MTTDSASVPLVPSAADEGTHQADADILWSESHYLDAVAPDAGTGVYVRLGRLPNQGRSHVMLAVVRPGAGPVVLADPEAPLPAIDGADHLLVAGAYRLSLAWDVPLRQLRVTARGAAARYTAPADAFGAASSQAGPGQPAAVELDLTWRTEGTPFRWRSQTRYEIPCRVRGQVTVDGERTDVDWVGQRDHSWGGRDWWSVDWNWLAVHLDDAPSRHQSVARRRRPKLEIGDIDAFRRDAALRADGPVRRLQRRTGPLHQPLDVATRERAQVAQHLRLGVELVEHRVLEDRAGPVVIDPVHWRRRVHVHGNHRLDAKAVADCLRRNIASARWVPLERSDFETGSPAP